MLGVQCSLFLLLLTTLQAAPFKLLAIGDSLTEEYRFEVPFSAPDSNPAVANTQNWVELLHEYREVFFTMGGYEPSAFNYADYRNAGYEYNYGVPGFKAEKWDEILYAKYSFSELFKPENIIAISTRTELRSDLGQVDAVLIFIGGNDLSLNSSEAENDQIRLFISRIHSWVRSNAPAGLPILVATVPDIGATPLERIDDPAQAAAARQRVARLNADIIATFTSLPNTSIVRIDNLTDRLFDQQPLNINGTVFTRDTDPENPPLTFFCKLGFHPATAGQALIANEILTAINRFAPTPIPLFSNREILSTILGLNPDQPFLDYVGSAGGIFEDPDGDALPNLVEYLLSTSPTRSDSGFTFLPGGSATFIPSPAAQRFADLTVLQSETLGDDWMPVPESNIRIQPDGAKKILPTAPKLFYKFRAVPKP